MYFNELSENQLRHQIDSRVVYNEALRVRSEARQLRGGMVWRTIDGNEYLIRTSSRGGQKSLGRRSDDTQAIFEKFTSRKAELASRVKDIELQLATQIRLNRALGVGRAPNVVVQVLNKLKHYGLDEHFLVIGTHAIYAYETAAGVRVQEAAMATRDVDLLFDTRKRLSFSTEMERIDSSFLGILQSVDKTFRIDPLKKETARNSKGFEIDLIRRIAKEDDPHPYRISKSEDDFWLVQVPSGNQLLSAPRMSEIIVATSGEMGLMHTVSPNAFVSIKRHISRLPERDPWKARKDALQADVVQALIDQYLPQWKQQEPSLPPPRMR